MNSYKSSDFGKSKPVVIIPYERRWQMEFLDIGKKLRSVVGDTAIRIDHIGSTSVQSLSAKDIIDVQISVAELDDAENFIELMVKAGYRERGGIRFDELTGYADLASSQMKKRYFREPDGARRTHIHVRQIGNINQEYALLFRDYLRGNSAALKSYQLIKQRLATLFPEQIEGYLFIKDPVMDLIYQSAKIWAANTSWSPGSDFL